MGKIKKDSDNPFFKYKYASLSTILDGIQKPMADAGLCFTQFPEGERSLTSILLHADSGEYLQSTYDIHPVKNDPQAVGSAITYARRYALGAMLGLNIDDDDDGNAASQPAKQQSAKQGNGAQKECLNPNTPKWDAAIKFLRDGGAMPDIEKKYSISAENKKKLIEVIMQPA